MVIKTEALFFNSTLKIHISNLDMFDDPAFDYTRRKAQEITEYMRRHGAFEPHRLPLEEMEYTTLPKVMEKLKSRFESVE